MPGEEALVSCGTTKGPIVMHLYRDWSPNGYHRAVDLFEEGFFDGSYFFRNVPNFLNQFGITVSDSEDLRSFMYDSIPDDPVPDPPIPFELGTMSFAGNGLDSRTTQMFIAYGNIPSLGREPWETPFGFVEEGIENVLNLHAYGDMPPWGSGPDPNRLTAEGAAYIDREFPLLDSFQKCSVEIIPGDEDEEEEEL